MLLTELLDSISSTSSRFKHQPMTAPWGRAEKRECRLEVVPIATPDDSNHGCAATALVEGAIKVATSPSAHRRAATNALRNGT